MLVIFDLDGTLVDSEKLCCQAFIDLIPRLSVSVEGLMVAYRGQKLAKILTDLENKLGFPLPENFESRYRQQVELLFEAELKAVDGVNEMLRQLPFPYCIASSGPLKKIKKALEVTKLTHFFEERIFSSYSINSWKPDPGLFLYAAESMGYDSTDCVVIEDSSVGLQAAIAAKMHWLLYDPFNSTKMTQGFHDMRELPAKLYQLATNEPA